MRTAPAHPNYRPDIDGLRAIAVLAVVWYHAAMGRAMAGGFTGVDIFFVISGYLISGIIWGNLEAGRFSYRDFYARRVRRIFPALLLVMAAALAAGMLILWSAEYAMLGKHVAAGAAFVSNIVSWREAGYFDVAGESKPLLHLWSLGIEEQFYILWPLLLGFAWNRRWPLLPVVGGVAAVSFGANLYVVHGHDAAGAFYLPFTRFWELMAGGLVAHLALHRAHWLARHGAWRSWLGAGCIAAGFYFINPHRAFPGWWALLPVTGAMLLISAGTEAWFNRVVLGSAPARWIGRISYPIYLWHWPLLAYTTILASGQKIHQDTYHYLALLSIPLAYLTYRYIERPLRHGGARTALALAGLMLLMAAGGYGLYALDGLPRPDGANSYGRMVAAQPDVLNPAYIIEALKDPIFAKSYQAAPGFETTGEPWPKVPDNSVLAMGDSHASRLFIGLRQNGWRNAMVLGHSICPPFFGVNAYTLDTPPVSFGCQPAMGRLLHFARSTPEIHTIILTGFFRELNRDMPIRDAASGQPIDPVDGMVRTVKAMANPRQKLVVALDVPEIPRLCRRRPFPVWRPLRESRCLLPESEVRAREAPMANAVQALMKQYPNVYLFRESDALCRDGVCGEIDDQHAMYILDGNHLSLYGTQVVGASLAAFLRGIGQTKTVSTPR